MPNVIKPTKFRWNLAILMFLISFIAYMDRVNLSVATPMIMAEFSLTKIDIGIMQTVFFVGYSIIQIPGGIMAEYFGHRRIVTLAIVWWSVFTALTAFGKSFTSLLIIRGLFGIGEGPLFPAFNNFVYKWFNKDEKAIGSSYMLGGAFIGPVFGPAITVALMMTWGWRSVFIIFGLAGLIFAIAWYVLGKDTPRESSFVNEGELKHIEQGMDVSQVEKKELAPWKAFMTSSQFWAIGIQYFITDYIMYVFLAWLPLYLMEAQNFSLAKMGIAASFPWALLAIMTFATAYISDKLVAKGLPKAKARTLFGVSGLVICCITLYLGAVATSPWMNVLWLTISLGSLGMTFSASWAACIDIGGKFSGSVSGWMNFWGNLGGVAAPTATAWIATNYGWQTAILVTAGSAIIGIIAWIAVKPDMPLTRKDIVQQDSTLVS